MRLWWLIVNDIIDYFGILKVSLNLILTWEFTSPVLWNWHKLVIFLPDKKLLLQQWTLSYATLFKQSLGMNVHFTFSKHFLDSLNDYLMTISMVDFTF